MNAGSIVADEQIHVSGESQRTDEEATLGGPGHRRLSVNVAFTLATRLLMLASSLGTSIVVARWLGAAGLGGLAVLNVTVALAVQIGCAGLPSANTFFISQDRTKGSEVWTNAMFFGLGAGGLLSALVILVARFDPSLLGNVAPSLLMMAAISIPFQLISLLGINVFLGIGRVDRFNQFDASSQLLQLFNAILVLIVLGLNLLALVVANTVAWTLLSICVVLILTRSLKQFSSRASTRASMELFRRLMRYAIKFHVSTVASLVILRADLLIVNHYRGVKEAGAYAVASQMGNLMMLLPAIIGTLLFPRVASEPDPHGGLTMRVTRHTAFLMLFACLAAVPLSFALPFVYGAEFHDSTLQLLILLPGVYLFGLESVMVQHFTGTGLPAAIPVFWILALICNVTLNLLLIPTYGAIAAAVTSTFSYSLIFVLVAAYFRRTTGNPFARALLLRGDEFRDLVTPIRLLFFSR